MMGTMGGGRKVPLYSIFFLRALWEGRHDNEHAQMKRCFKDKTDDPLSPRMEDVGLLYVCEIRQLGDNFE